MSVEGSSAGGPHGGSPIKQGGASLAKARLAVVLAHGRGGSGDDMLRLGEHLAIADIAYLAPEAAGHSCWPQSFLAPLEANEPGLSSALAAFEAAVGLASEAGFGPDRLIVGGFSQGACLALEHAARAGRPYRGVIGLSGGLIGTQDGDGQADDSLYGHAPKRFVYSGRIDGSVVFLGCHARDPHIPLARVRKSGEVLTALGAQLTEQIYPGAGHGVVDEEIAFLRGHLNA